MKKLILIAAIGLSQNVFSEILNSNLEDRHQKAIESAISEKCYLTGIVSQVSSLETIVKIDQGITDIHYSTELNLIYTLDQNITSEYKVIVQSTLSDMYDHNFQTWGAYSVDSITCEQK